MVDVQSSSSLPAPKRKGGERRTVAQRAQDIERMAKLYLEGKTQTEMARRLGCSQAQISQDIDKLHRMWLASAMHDFDLSKARQLARIDHLERTAYEGYALSLEARTSQSQDTVVSTRKNGKGEDVPVQGPKRSSVRKESSTGDPRYLQLVQWCIDARNKLMALIPDGKLDLAGTSGKLILTWGTAVVDQRDPEAVKALTEGMTEGSAAEMVFDDVDIIDAVSIVDNMPGMDGIGEMDDLFDSADDLEDMEDDE